MNKRSATAGNKLPRVGTVPARRFFESWKQIDSFFNWVLHMAIHIDRSSEAAHKALVETSHTETERERLEENWKRRVSPIEQLKSHRQFLIEIILVRHVENFLNYLSGLLYEIFTQRPETLRSADKVDLERVLRHESIEALVRDVAQRKVESLSYSSFDDLCTFFAERFGLTVASGNDLRALLEAVEIRNISVHNRCVINARFVARTGAPGETIGKTKQLYIGDLDRLVPLLASRSGALDSQARRKLRLRGSRFFRPNHAPHPTGADGIASAGG